MFSYQAGMSNLIYLLGLMAKEKHVGQHKRSVAGDRPMA